MLDIYWQAPEKWRGIKEAITRLERRMLYFNQIRSSMGSWNMCFCSPFSSVRNNGWLSVAWMTCSVSQGWMRWPCAGKRQAFEQEAHTGNDRCIVAWRLKPCLQSVGNVPVKFHCFQGCSVQGHVLLLLLGHAVVTCTQALCISDFCVFAQPWLLIKINKPTEELWRPNALNHRKLEHCVDSGEEM